MHASRRPLDGCQGLAGMERKQRKEGCQHALWMQWTLSAIARSCLWRRACRRDSTPSAPQDEEEEQGGEGGDGEAGRARLCWVASVTKVRSARFTRRDVA